MSRTVNGEVLLGDREKEVLRKMMIQVADFSGVEVLTYCLMNNHFHLLIRVPPADSVSDQELMRRYRVLYPKPTKYQTASINVMVKLLEDGGEQADAIRQQLLARMGDLSAFMKTLKQRFSTWFNKTHDRFGPLWSDRFKSVLVEGTDFVLQTMAAYIDLNPVRAGIVEDPKDYRFCGYAEALASNGDGANALRGLKFVTSGCYEVTKGDALAAYRCMLFGKGAKPAAGSAHMDRAKAARVLEKEQGYLPAATLLRCRIRYFSEGVVLGSSEFVRAQMDAWQCSAGRQYPPKTPLIRCEEAPALSVMHGVRGDAYS